MTMYDDRMFDVVKLETKQRLAAFCRPTRSGVDQASAGWLWYRPALAQLGQGLITVGEWLKGDDRPSMAANGLGQARKLAR